MLQDCQPGATLESVTISGPDFTLRILKQDAGWRVTVEGETSRVVARLELSNIPFIPAQGELDPGWFAVPSDLGTLRRVIGRVRSLISGESLRGSQVILDTIEFGPAVYRYLVTRPDHTFYVEVVDLRGDASELVIRRGLSNQRLNHNQVLQDIYCQALRSTGLCQEVAISKQNLATAGIEFVVRLQPEASTTDSYLANLQTLANLFPQV